MGQQRLLAHRTRSWVKRAAKGIAAPWVTGVEVESRKKKKEDTRTAESEDNVATVPRQRLQKACWYFVTLRIKSVSARIPLLLPPKSIPGYRIHWET